MRVGEGLKVSGAGNMISSVSNINLGEKRKLYERSVVPTMKFGVEILCKSMYQRHKVDVMQSER